MQSEDDLTEDERRVLAEWLVGERSAADPKLVALRQRVPGLPAVLERMRGVVAQLDANAGQFRDELSAALRSRPKLGHLDQVAELVARALREREQEGRRG